MGRHIAAVSFLGALAGCASNAENAAPAAEATRPAFVVVQPEPDPAATPDEVAMGGFLFANMCATCHGGAGRSSRGIAINRSDYAGVRDIIARGTIIYGGNMPAWTGILSPDQIDDVTKYILASQKK